MSASVRALPIVVVTLVLIGLVLVLEPLRDIYAGRVSFNTFGHVAFLTLTIASAGGVFLIMRARRLDAGFRGISSELTRIVALAELAVLLVAWGLYLAR